MFLIISFFFQRLERIVLLSHLGPLFWMENVEDFGLLIVSHVDFGEEARGH